MSSTLEPAGPAVAATAPPSVASAIVAAESAPAARPTLKAADWRVAAWRSFLRAHSHVLRQLEQDLQVNHKISLAVYDVLVQLAEAPERRLRMSELADAVLLSRSGLTRLIDRMQRDGLVQRQPDPCDARGLYTVLTPAGLAALKDAAVVHLSGVRELVLDQLSDEDLKTLQRLMNQIDPVALPADDSDAACGSD